MSPKAKWEYMKTVYDRYVEAKGRKAKGRILDEFHKTYGCHRNHAKRLLNAPPPPATKPGRNPRGSRYSAGRLIKILEGVWKASGYMCGQRLKPTLTLWMPAIRERFKTTKSEESLLSDISAPTIDRRLRPFKDKLGRRLYGTTRRGRLLKHQIPIKTDCWDVDRPGYTEVDLVSHSGDCAEGNFAHTLGQVDICATWVERRCVPNKSQEAVCSALDEMRRELPFKLLGVDADNGGEFINDHLWRYCRTAPAINDLYRHELRWFQNLFQPTMKIQAKTRVGSRVRRKYGMAKTPLERVIESGYGIPEKIAELKRLRDSLDPFALSRVIEVKLQRIWAMRSKAPQPAWIQQRVIPSYWRKRLEGPPMEPETRPALERFERIYKKEAAQQTW